MRNCLRIFRLICWLSPFFLLSCWGFFCDKVFNWERIMFPGDFSNHFPYCFWLSGGINFTYILLPAFLFCFFFIVLRAFALFCLYSMQLLVVSSFLCFSLFVAILMFVSFLAGGLFSVTALIIVFISCIRAFISFTSWTTTSGFMVVSVSHIW